MMSYSSSLVITTYAIMSRADNYVIQRHGATATDNQILIDSKIGTELVRNEAILFSMEWPPTHER